MAELPAETEDSKENLDVKMDDADNHQPEPATDIPTKCVQGTRTIAVNASITYIDFEGRSDGESLEKILAQLRPRRVILVRGSKIDTDILAQHARNVDARVFIPSKGEILDATTETHIYQVREISLLTKLGRMFCEKTLAKLGKCSLTKLFFFKVRLTDALVSGLNFSKGRADSDLAWVDALITARDQICQDVVNEDDDSVAKKDKILTLEPLPVNEV